MPDEERDYAAELEAALWEEDFALAHKIVSEMEMAEEKKEEDKKFAIDGIMKDFHHCKYDDVHAQISDLAGPDEEGEETKKGRTTVEQTPPHFGDPKHVQAIRSTDTEQANAAGQAAQPEGVASEVVEMSPELIERARERLGELAYQAGRASVQTPALAELGTRTMTGYRLSLRDLDALSEADCEGIILAGLDQGRAEAGEEVEK